MAEAKPSPLEEYLFDLRGYLVIEQATGPALVDAINQAIDKLPPVEPMGWIDHVHHFAGEKDSYVDGLFIDECLISVRGPSGHHPAHSGGYKGRLGGLI